METKPRPAPILTVLERARELHILLSQVVLDENVLLRIYRDSVGKAVTDHSQLVYESICVANSLDLYDKDLSEERVRLQTLARREITRLLASLRVFYSITQTDSDKMSVLIQKTIEVERLLKKWMESDLARQGASLHILKRDKIDTSFMKHKITCADIMGTAPVRVDFDRLLADAKQNAPAKYHLDPEVPRYIPPADTLPKAPVPEPIIKKMSEEDRIKMINEDIHRFDAPVPKDIPPPLPKSKFQVVPAREPEIKIVPLEPIVIPDCSVEPQPPVSEEEKNKPLAPTVEICKVTSPYEVSEVIEESKPNEESKKKEVKDEAKTNKK